MAGLLAGALSMGAGEYVSVRSQRELLEASSLNPQAGTVIPQLDIDANELALVYRARGMSESDAAARADDVLRDHSLDVRGDHQAETNTDEHEAARHRVRRPQSPVSASFFASGALVPVLPYLFGLQGVAALCRGGRPRRRRTRRDRSDRRAALRWTAPRPALRQSLIGYGAATITYLLRVCCSAPAPAHRQPKHLRFDAAPSKEH